MNSAPGMSRLHHVAIQTRDLRNCAAWYRSFLDLRENWTTSVFSETTLCRLPGIVRLTEVGSDVLRLHIFELADATPGDRSRRGQFQHVCLAVAAATELRRIRQRWIELFESGTYRFSHREHPTEIAVDDTGTENFYCLDVDGLELEFAYERGGEP